jgi:hypothetical protein
MMFGNRLRFFLSTVVLALLLGVSSLSTPASAVTVVPSVGAGQCSVVLPAVPTPSNAVSMQYSLDCVGLGVASYYLISGEFQVGSGYYVWQAFKCGVNVSSPNCGNITTSESPSSLHLVMRGVYGTGSSCFSGGIGAPNGCLGPAVMDGAGLMSWDLASLYYTSTAPTGGALTAMNSRSVSSSSGAVFVLSGARSTPCTLLSVNASTTALGGPTSDGTTAYNYSISFSGQVQTIVANDDFESTNGTGQFTIYGHSGFSSDAVYSDMGAGRSLVSPVVLSPVNVSTTTVDPDLWCYDGSSWYQWGLVNGFGAATVNGEPTIGAVGTNTDTSPTSGTFDFNSCLADTGMSLTNPFSWISGGAKIMVCGLQWLFIPSGDSVSTLANQFGITSNDSVGGPSGFVSGSSVSQWLGSGALLLATGPTTSMGAIQSAESGGATSAVLNVGPSVRANGVVYTASIPDAISAVTSNSTLAAALAVLLVLLTAGLGVIFFLLIMRLIRRVLGSGE